MTFFDNFLTITVIILFFFLIYMGIRKQGIGETLQEIKDVFDDKKEVVQDGMKYA